jgi:hypothetical protein
MEKACRLTQRSASQHGVRCHKAGIFIYFFIPSILHLWSHVNLYTWNFPAYIFYVFTYSSLCCLSRPTHPSGIHRLRTLHKIYKTTNCLYFTIILVQLPYVEVEKVKLSLGLIKHHVMKTLRVEAYFHSFLTSALDGYNNWQRLPWQRILGSLNTSKEIPGEYFN